MAKAAAPPHNNRKTSVLVSDSTSLTAGLIADTLRRDRGFEIFQAKGSSLLTAATTLKPDIVVLSEKLEATAGQGFAVLKLLREAVPGTRTIMLLDSDERDVVVEAFRCGARGVFSRNDPLKMLNKCVHKVYEGQLWASDPHLEFLLQALAETPAMRLVDAQGARLLSEREEEVVLCLAKGLTNIQIARELKLAENTVKNYLYRIFNKLGVSSRVEVVIYADQKNRARTAS
jgi:two-component system, NarL family, nitrate/nitrite response regulator NarL